MSTLKMQRQIRLENRRGLSLAAELFDLLNVDLTKRFPRIFRNKLYVYVIHRGSHFLNADNEALSMYAELIDRTLILSKLFEYMTTGLVDVRLVFVDLSLLTDLSSLTVGCIDTFQVQNRY
ncbi:hypothetical protein F5Y16DRAFT_29072 [Xylariaceae sp. FL0255]|nr:hypothetical protein F5Y16DRAFT_29072 [Xylariaceae sp. FL0255]